MNKYHKSIHCYKITNSSNSFCFSGSLDQLMENVTKQRLVYTLYYLRTVYNGLTIQICTWYSVSHVSRVNQSSQSLSLI